MVENALPYSTAATSFVPAGMSKTADGQDFAKFAKQDYRYDAEKAKSLWEEGLKEVGLTNLTLSLEAAADLAPAKTTANYLQTSYEKKLYRA